MSSEFLGNYIPFDIFHRPEEGILCKWVYAKDVAFTEPFFSETVAKCRTLASRRRLPVVVTSVEKLVEIAETVESVPLKGFIYHTSRCGSTLLTQLLSIQKENIVVSEFEMIDKILRWNYAKENPVLDVPKYLQSVIKIIGQRRSPEEQNLIVKLDCWHIFFAELLNEVFPRVKNLYLYRSPQHVVSSQLKKAGSHCIPGLIEPEISGIQPEEIHVQKPSTYVVSLLGQVFENILYVSKNDDRGLLLTYSEGFEQILAMVRKTLDLKQPDAKEIEEIRERMNFHSKYPGEKFEADLPVDANEFPLLSRVYQMLEELRLERVIAV